MASDVAILKSENATLRTTIEAKIEVIKSKISEYTSRYISTSRPKCYSLFINRIPSVNRLLFTQTSISVAIVTDKKCFHVGPISAKKSRPLKIIYHSSINLKVRSSQAQKTL